MPSKPHGAVQKPAVWLPDQPSQDFIDEDGDMSLVLFIFQLDTIYTHFFPLSGWIIRVLVTMSTTFLGLPCE